MKGSIPENNFMKYLNSSNIKTKIGEI